MTENPAPRQDEMKTQVNEIDAWEAMTQFIEDNDVSENDAAIMELAITSDDPNGWLPVARAIQAARRAAESPGTVPSVPNAPEDAPSLVGSGGDMYRTIADERELNAYMRRAERSRNSEKRRKRITNRWRGFVGGARNLWNRTQEGARNLAATAVERAQEIPGQVMAVPDNIQNGADTLYVSWKGNSDRRYAKFVDSMFVATNRVADAIQSFEEGRRAFIPGIKAGVEDFAADSIDFVAEKTASGVDAAAAKAVDMLNKLQQALEDVRETPGDQVVSLVDSVRNHANENRGKQVQVREEQQNVGWLRKWLRSRGRQ